MYALLLYFDVLDNEMCTEKTYEIKTIINENGSTAKETTQDICMWPNEDIEREFYVMLAFVFWKFSASAEMIERV